MSSTGAAWRVAQARAGPSSCEPGCRLARACMLTLPSVGLSFGALETRGREKGKGRNARSGVWPGRAQRGGLGTTPCAPILAKRVGGDRCNFLRLWSYGAQPDPSDLQGHSRPPLNRPTWGTHSCPKLRPYTLAEIGGTHSGPTLGACTPEVRLGAHSGRPLRALTLGARLWRTLGRGSPDPANTPPPIFSMAVAYNFFKTRSSMHCFVAGKRCWSACPECLPQERTPSTCLECMRAPNSFPGFRPRLMSRSRPQRLRRIQQQPRPPPWAPSNSHGGALVRPLCRSEGSMMSRTYGSLAKPRARTATARSSCQSTCEHEQACAWHCMQSEYTYMCVSREFARRGTFPQSPSSG